MIPIKENDGRARDRLTVTTVSLKEILDCGEETAVKIGTAAGAKLKFGRRTLWHVGRIRSYLDSIAE